MDFRCGQVLAGIDLVCLTSKNEGTPVSLIEAGCAGKPFISTDVGGIKDILEDPSQGCVLEDNSIEALETALVSHIDGAILGNTLLGVRERQTDMVINNFVYQWPRSILVCFPCNACDALYSLIFRIVRALIPFVVVLLLSSCRVLVPDRMFRNGEFQQFVSDKNNMEDYSIRPGDVIRVQLYTQDGFPILDALRMESSQGDRALGQLLWVPLFLFLLLKMAM